MNKNLKNMTSLNAKASSNIMAPTSSQNHFDVQIARNKGKSHLFLNKAVLDVGLYFCVVKCHQWKNKQKQDLPSRMLPQSPSGRVRTRILSLEPAHRMSSSDCCETVIVTTPDQAECDKFSHLPLASPPHRPSATP